jgi:hypothetical protein
MLLPPPQPDHVINVMSTQKKASPRSILPFRLRTLLPTSISPGKPENASPSASILRLGGSEKGYARLADVPAVVTATVTGAVVAPLSVRELGETEHVDCAGTPLHVNVTVWLNPPPGATATVYFATCPGATVAVDEEDGAREKSCPVPESGTVCGLLLALSVTDKTPFLGPLVVGSKNTPIEQVAPGTTLFPQELSGAKSEGLAFTFVIVITASPVFFNVTACGSPEVPTYCFGKATVGGEKLIPVMPAPVNGTVCGLPGALSVTVSEALAFPTAFGEKVTLILQLVFGDSDEGQLLV